MTVADSPEKMLKARFKTKARLVKMLGEHLIRDNTVGLMELVKNGYDADAENVTVEILNTKSSEETKIIVKDDGFGMSHGDIVNRWFEPAHGEKDRQKASGVRTPLGRLPLGEKGVGRFAVQKLGSKLELITRPADENIEYTITIDWEDFEDHQKYLEDIEIPVESREPVVFVGANSHGTHLVMTGARQKWSRKDLERFQASLIRLLSPRKVIDKFNVTFHCPDYPELQNLDHYDILEHFKFRIDCLIDEDGFAQCEYQERDVEGKITKKTIEENIWGQVNPDGWTTRKPACGPFYIQLSAWLLDANQLEPYGINKDQLKILSGVSIYRDNFRILPYGDEGDDWLGLDPRRINLPTRRFGNRQVIGIVEINQETSPLLVDKTNREGLQEHQAFQDLREIVLGVVQLIEQESLQQRKVSRSSTETKRELKSTIEDLKNELETLKKGSEPISSGVDIADEAELPENITSDETESEFQDNAVPENMILVERDKLEELEGQAKAALESINEIYDTKEEDRETFLHLLAIGLAAERFSHEFDRLVDNSSRCIQELKGFIGSQNKPLEQLEVFTNVLRNELRLMGTLRYVRRSQRARVHSAKKIVGLVLAIHEKDLASANISVETSFENDFDVYISEASFAQVIDNIVDNAIYWLKQKSQINERNLKIELLSDARQVLVSNNGPAILPNIRQQLFKTPFLTAKKPDGRGLGMYISSEILKLNGGKIELAKNDDSRLLSGAGFIVSLPLHQES